MDWIHILPLWFPAEIVFPLQVSEWDIFPKLFVVYVNNAQKEKKRHKGKIKRKKSYYGIQQLPDDMKEKRQVMKM